MDPIAGRAAINAPIEAAGHDDQQHQSTGNLPNVFFSLVLKASSRRLDMTEDLKHSRTDIDQPGRICFDGTSLGCRIINISANGAAVEVINARDVPDRFQLMTEHDRVEFNCQVVWIKQNRIGLAFE